MKTVEKSQLKANLLEFLQLVELEGEEILVMDGTKPVVIISQYTYFVYNWKDKKKCCFLLYGSIILPTELQKNY